MMAVLSSVHAGSNSQNLWRSEGGLETNSLSPFSPLPFPTSSPLLHSPHFLRRDSLYLRESAPLLHHCQYQGISVRPLTCTVVLQRSEV